MCTVHDTIICITDTNNFFSFWGNLRLAVDSCTQQPCTSKILNGWYFGSGPWLPFITGRIDKNPYAKQYIPFSN